jgi:diadenosine tetraphosphate (Ap4A) HIT family hydrolase
LAVRAVATEGSLRTVEASGLLVAVDGALRSGGVPTIFTRIIDGQIPGTFVWRDDQCVAFLSINPMGPGHTLVVPIEEVDHWIDASPGLNAHLFGVAQVIGQAQQAAFDCDRVGLILAGYEVPHLHVHVIPTTNIRQFNFALAGSATPEQLAATAEPLRASLRAMGRAEVVER